MMFWIVATDDNRRAEPIIEGAATSGGYRRKNKKAGLAWKRGGGGCRSAASFLVHGGAKKVEGEERKCGKANRKLGLPPGRARRASLGKRGRPWHAPGGAIRKKLRPGKTEKPEEKLHGRKGGALPAGKSRRGFEERWGLGNSQICRAPNQQGKTKQ